MADCKDVIPENGLIHRIGYSIVLTRTNTWLNPLEKALTSVSIFLINFVCLFVCLFVHSISCNADKLVRL